MRPTRVLEVELSSAAVDHPCPDHEVARILVRLHGTPLGFLDLPVTDGVLRFRDVLTTAERDLPVAAHLAADGIAKRTDRLKAWACQAPGPFPLPTTLSVVLCTRDRPDSLRLALQSVLLAVRLEDEVLVVDNAPQTSATQDVVAELGDARLRYLLEPRPGLSIARNTGALATTGEVIAFTDDDVVVDAGWINGLLRGFTRTRRVGLVTGLVPSAELETAPQHFFDRKVHWSSSTTQRLYDLGLHRADSALYPYQAGMIGTGANFAVSEAAYRDLGPFDPALGAGAPTRGGEDLDYFVRALTRGWTIAYEPSSVVWHRHRRDLESLSDQLYGYGTGLSAYLAKHALTTRAFFQIARTALRGVRYLKGREDSALGASIDPALLRRERIGMLQGPWLYAKARRALHRRTPGSLAEGGQERA